MKKIIKYLMSFSFVFLLFPVSVNAEEQKIFLAEGEFLEAECTLNDITRIQLIPFENGTYEGMNFYHLKDKVIVNKGSEQMIFDLLSGEIFLDGEKSPTVCKFLNLEVLENRNNENAEKVEQEKTNIDDADSGDTEVEIIQLLESMKIRLNKLEKKLDALNEQVKGVGVSDVSDAGKGGESKVQRPGVYEAKCGLVKDDGQYAINPTQLINPIMFDDLTEGDWKQNQIIAINALVKGNGNQAIFNGRAYYRKTGNMIELITLDDNGSPSFNFTTNVSAEQFQEHFGLFPEVTCTAG
jgi:hypothetical protein